MCGRYTLHHKSEELAERYGLGKLDGELRQNFNVAPGQIMPVVFREEGEPALAMMKWGLIPFWAKDSKIGYKLINARDDTLFQKPTWRQIIKSKRCLIPADGFYEWKKLDSSSKPAKQPYYIRPKDLEIFSFAGIWSGWKDPEGAQWLTYSIITTSPNKEMENVHDRMPVILNRDEEASWLDPDKTEKEDIEPFLHPYQDGGLEMYKVTTDVNSPRNNDSHLIYALD